MGPINSNGCVGIAGNCEHRGTLEYELKPRASGTLHEAQQFDFRHTPFYLNMFFPGGDTSTMQRNFALHLKCIMSDQNPKTSENPGHGVVLALGWGS